MALSARRIENGGLVLFAGFVTLFLGAIVSSYAVALLWSVLAAILFQPLYHRLRARFPDRPNTAALLTLLIITVAVVLPTLIIGTMVIDQASGVYAKVRSGQINFAAYFQQVHDALPLKLQQLADKAGLDSFERTQAQISNAIGSRVSMIASRALSIGADALAAVVAFGVGLYATFFLLRDGDRLGPAVCRALPLERSVTTRLVDRFVSVMRATIKGSVIVGLVQGALGAITFWLVGLPAAMLWGLLMAIASLLPAIGPAIIWIPVAIYLLATSALWQGVVVIVSGALVIGSADNILRPILVGRDTGIPDWVVLVTTLGGIELLGLSGIVVGPVVAALFITAWQILTEQRERGTRARDKDEQETDNMVADHR
ncbi:AI-2E family transporter [uncultured Sphingomonas sp.]|uniref:AI-2E family transporter n=1 Tax=uncultured Sphingomonas sp. TaxID=158754 RepID=UPI0025CCD1F0|nr:AI-2E family transporter [uncultured Sphingomonas sp.]